MMVESGGRVSSSWTRGNETTVRGEDGGRSWGWRGSGGRVGWNVVEPLSFCTSPSSQSMDWDDGGEVQKLPRISKN